MNEFSLNDQVQIIPSDPKIKWEVDDTFVFHTSTSQEIICSITKTSTIFKVLNGVNIVEPLQLLHLKVVDIFG